MQDRPISGVLVNDSRILRGDSALPSLTFRDVLNKIIHGTPVSVEVRDNDVRLHFVNSSTGDNWTSVWFSGTQLLEQFDSVLYKHRNELNSENGRSSGS